MLFFTTRTPNTQRRTHPPERRTPNTQHRSLPHTHARTNFTFIIIVLLLLYTAVGNAAPAPLKLSAQWLGQDGRDLTSPSSTLAPNDVQDVHIVVSNIPADRTIASGVLMGYGGGEWHYNGDGGSWKIALERQPHAPTADFYFDPGDFNTERHWDFHLVFDDGSTGDAGFEGKKTDPGRRMPAASLKAQWLGQDGQDWTGPGPSVGPDGFQDAHLVLTNLSPKVEVKSIAITLAGSDVAVPPVTGGEHQGSATSPPDTWEYGLNPKGYANAELIRHPDDPSKADLFFSPGGNLAGQTLVLKLLYTPGQPDSTTVAAGPTKAALPMPAPPPVTLPHLQVKADWRGQLSAAAGGDTMLILRGLPGNTNLDAVDLTDSVGGCWVWHQNGSPGFTTPAPSEDIQPPLEMKVVPQADPSSAVLYLQPFRNETGTRMTMRLRFKSGAIGWFQFMGGSCNPFRQGPLPLTTGVAAKPGDDLQALLGTYGAVILAAGTYRLTHPLDLPKPVTLSGSRDAILEFSQPAGDTTLWQTAIKIDSSNTTLDGFKVRFATPIHWAPEDWVNGSAVLGMTAPTPQRTDRGFNINITNMDIESPPIPPGVPLEQEPRLMRLIYCTSGKILNNILKGGVTDVMHGPWVIRDNDYQGTQPGSFDYSAFACHYTHDYYLGHNTVHAVGPSGKNWRFLVMTQAGDSDVVEGNDARDVGPKDNDTIPNPNAAEILLTEAYRLHFEGRPSAIGQGGLLLQIPVLMGYPVRNGDVVSVLSGPHRGEWHRIAQPIDSTTFLMDAPLPPGAYNISISRGFVGETYQRNTIDMRGSSTSGDMILAGNHFGTRVLNNHTLGGGDSFQCQATPTERPNIWGWSHAPFLGALIEGNIFEDSLKGGTLYVQHNSKYIKSNKDRVYFTGVLRNNVVRWTADFLAHHHPTTDHSYPPTFKIGDVDSLDPGELNLLAEGNSVQAPGYDGGAAMQVVAARLNGQIVRDVAVPLP